MRAPYGGGFGLLAGNHAYALIQFARHIAGRADLEKGHTVLLAGGENPLAGLLHFRRIGVARDSVRQAGSGGLAEMIEPA